MTHEHVFLPTASKVVRHDDTPYTVVIDHCSFGMWTYSTVLGEWPLETFMRTQKPVVEKPIVTDAQFYRKLGISTRPDERK